MKYTMTTPCKDCPFTMTRKQFTDKRLAEFASGEFPCHKTAELIDDEDSGCGEFHAGDKSVHCAGALLYNEKRNSPHQMMRIAERFRQYDHTKLNKDIKVR